MNTLSGNGHAGARQTLHSLSAVLLHPESGYGALHTAANTLFHLLCSLADVQVRSADNRTDLLLPTGRAIGPTWAAMCLQDFMRTHRFLLGLLDGIRECRNRFPGQTIHVLYAGTGPFATLALPMTTMFSPAEVQFTFLEINPASIAYLEKTIAAFGIEKFVRNTIECDAARFDARACKPYHLLVSETMQNGLQKEPQVSITLNLAPGLEPGGLLVPEQVTIDAGYLNTSTQAQMQEGADLHIQSVLPLQRVFDLSLKGLSALKPDVSQWHSPWTFPEIRVEIPADADPQYSQFCLFTTIQIFGKHCLRYRDSGLTLPKTLLHRQRIVENNITAVSLRYVLEPEPGFEWHAHRR